MTAIVNSITVLVVIFLSQGAKANLLACLGQEELSIHRDRAGGAIYYLNQLFINRLASSRKPVLGSQYRQKICGRKGVSPSVALLKNLLLVGDRIFINSRVVSLTEREIARTFFTFLLKIQKMASNHQCLEKHLPHYSHFIHRYKYLETEGIIFLKEKNKLLEMFNVLERMDFLLAKCRRSGVSKKSRGKP